MRELGRRVLTTLVGVPAVFCLLVLLPQRNHLAFAIVVFLAVALGSWEMSRLLFGGAHPACLLPVLLPLAQYLEMLEGWRLPLTQIVFALLALLSFVPELRAGARDGFKGSASVCARRLLLVFYPGYLATFVVRILAWNTASRTGGLYLLLMIALVFANDIFAYVFGRSLGRRKNIVPASPNKSLEGFVGGTLCCVLASFLLCRFVFVEIRPLPSLLLGLAISVAANIGDLVESLFKRSAGVKDSGGLFPGRGGMLDSLDSIVASAPVFLLFLETALS